MFVVGQLLGGLVCIHLFWIYFLITGTLVRSNQKSANDIGDPPLTAPFFMTDLVITTVTGMAVTGFVVLLFGFLGLLNAYAFLVWLVVEGFLFKVVRGENIFVAEFWRWRFKLVKRAWSLPSIIIYCAFLLISVPAILPPTLWDSVSYHLAYAVAWANAGQIYVDEFIRFPYYSNNFLLLYALLFALKLGPICQWLTWLCGLLTGLGVYSLIAQPAVVRPDSKSVAALGVPITAVILPLALAVSPVFLRYVDTAYVDVQIGLFVLIPILCAFIRLQGGGRRYELEFVLTAAFCVGMKITNIFFLPLFLGSLVLVAIRKRDQPLSRLLVMGALLVGLSAPWYVRNLIATGDPVSPALNVLLKRTDPIWTPRDVANARADFTTSKAPATLLRLPFDLFWNTSTKNFRERGTNSTVVLLYVPFIMAGLLLVRRIRNWFGLPFVYLNVALVYVLVYWIGISTLARYFLHVFPFYTAYIGIWLNKLLAASLVNPNGNRGRRPLNLLLTAILMCLMLLPSPMALRFYSSLVQADYLRLNRRLRSYQGYLRRNLPGYVATQYIITKLEPNNTRGEKTLLVGFENLTYYFRKNSFLSFGDWFGPGRFSDLLWSIDHEDLSSYLAEFNVRAVLINLSDKRMDAPTYRHFIKQLEDNHFVLQPTQEPSTAIYFKSE